MMASLVAANAQVLSDGYYRVQNSTTKRWAMLADDKAHVNKAVAGPEGVNLNAIRTYLNFDRIVSNPGSVIKLTYSSSGGGYTLGAQGTNTLDMLKDYGSYYLTLRQSGRTYIASAHAEGVDIHLADEPLKNEEIDDTLGFMNPSGSSTQYWYITPVDATTDNYFGFTPSLTVGGKYYQPFYADFGFTSYSEGIKAYYVDRVSEGLGIAELREITDDVKPAAVPMIIEATSIEPANNKINIVDDRGNTPSDNKLSGVYFCATNDLLNWWDYPSGDHEVYTINDSATMRLLDVENGQLVLKKSKVKYLPANSFYLKVSKSCPDVLRLLSAEEFATGISSVKVETKSADNAVYNLNGQRVSTSGLDNLPAGVYIQNWKKIIRRKY